MEKPKLLIVDDDEGIRNQMKWALSDAYDISLAEDREGALAVARAEKPSLILLDLGLPPDPRGAGEGLKAPGKIGELDRTAKVVIITGNSEKAIALREHGLRTGFEDILGESPPMQQIFSLVRKVAPSDASVLIYGESGTGKE